MTAAGSQPGPNDLLCWTYAGTFDDMLERFPWTEKSSSEAMLDVQLAYSVAVGRPLLLNDGYLVLNQACFESLKNEYSPLRVLMRRGYVKVLSRSKSRSLRTMVEESAAEGIQTFELLVNNSERWDKMQQVLQPVDAEKPGFVGWPGVNLVLSYRALLHSLAEVSPQERGLGKVKDALFLDLLQRFDEALENEKKKPRSKWEDLVMQHVRNKPDRLALMQMANEIYHHNFGVALKATPPPELMDAPEIAVLSRTSAPFANLYRSYTLDPALAGRAIPQLTLPKGVNYRIGNILTPLLEEGEPIGQARTNYLQVRRRFMNGSSDAAELEAATKSYQAGLDRYLGQYSESEKKPKETAKHTASLAVSAATVAIGLAYPSTAPVILVGALAYLSADFMFPALMDKYKVDRAFKWMGHKATKRPPEWQDIIVGKGAMTALPVDQGAAQKIAGKLPAFR